MRDRGARYFAEGRVALVPGPNRVDAGVRGSAARQYRTTISAPDDHTIYLSCTCAFAAELEPCKHMWAVLLAADRRQAAPTIRALGLVDVIISDGVDEELFPAPADPIDMGEAFPLVQPGKRYSIPVEPRSTPEPMNGASRAGAAVATKTASPKGSATMGKSTWRTRLTRLGGERSHGGMTSPRAMPLEYVAHVRGPAPGFVDVRPMRRNTRADGSPGASIEVTYAHARSPFTPEDRAIVDRLLQGQYGYVDYSLFHGHAAKLAAILPRIARTGRLRRALPDTKNETVALVWAGEEPFRLVLSVQKEARGGARAEWLLVRGEERLPLRDVRAVVGSIALLDDRALQLDRAPSDAVWELVRGGELRASASEIDAFITLLARTASLPPLDIDAELGWAEAHVTPVPVARFRWPDRGDGKRAVSVDLRFAYGDQEIALDDEQPGLGDPVAKQLSLRDHAAENAAWARLMELGVLPRSPASPYAEARDEESDGVIAPGSVPAVVRQLLADGWRVEAQGRRLRTASSLAMKVTSGIDWFDLSVEADFEGTSLEIEVLLSALRRGERFIQLGDGTFGMLPEQWLERYGPLASAGQVEGDSLRFRKSQALILDALLSLAPEVDVDAQFARLRDELHSFERLEPADPPARFVGELRHYQKEGLSWLRFLDRVGFGGCLADDMGLGKTVQVLALLSGRPKSSPPSLVVAPRSLVSNWCEEAARFTPRLRVLDYTGSSRQPTDIAKHDLVLTTYGTLRRDIEHLRAHHFDYVVLDEAQAIKNPRTNVAKAARLLSADHRLALTGTPIENGLSDLASIFEVLNPGMIDSVDSLRALSSAQAPDDLDLLRRALKPFLLRRTKAAVLPDLPEKTEQTLRCRLEGRQRKLYDKLLGHYRASLEKRVAANGLARSKIHVLEALLRLRQAACHAGLLEKNLRNAPSAKLEVLVDHLVEVTARGHKALVFSQFTSFLDIVRGQLKRNDIPFSYLDGKTRARDRAAAVERFQTDPACLAFLISLKAGGTGLNLTAADYVFLLDPWWNPAVEAQAIDRTHRIGQARPVFAYRLIAEGTIEEKVLDLQQTKRDLVGGLFSDDESLLRGLTAEDLAALLA